MTSKRSRLGAALLALSVCVVVPTSQSLAGSPSRSALWAGAAARSPVGASRSTLHRKHRCGRGRQNDGGRRLQVCIQPLRTVGRAPLPIGTPTVAEPPRSGPGVGPGTAQPGEEPPPVPVPEGFELVDLIEDNGFESSVAGFEAGSPFDGSVATTTVDPIEGLQSLQVTLNGYSRISSPYEYPYEGGPFADSVSVAGKLRMESSTVPGLEDEVCVVVYIENESEPHATCQSFPVDPAHVVEFLLTQDTAARQLARVYFEFKRTDAGTTVAALDDAHFYVVQEKAG